MPWWVIPPTVWALALLGLPAWQQVSRRDRREGLRRGLLRRNGQEVVTGQCYHEEHHVRERAVPAPSSAATDVPRDAIGGFAPPFPLGRASRAPHPALLELNEILAEMGEPATCLEETERAGIELPDEEAA